VSRDLFRVAGCSKAKEPGELFRRVGVLEPENQVSFFRRMGVLALVSRDLFKGVGVLALACLGTFSREWMSCRWGAKGPFQGSGCPDAKVSRYLFRGEGVLASGCRGTFSRLLVVLKPKSQRNYSGELVS
jgi:hypothetical protein